ncbi:MAG: VanZ family protein [Anaerolineae bacterium]|nr:VanZ family protein [Anaerolineae bacterium]
MRRITRVTIAFIVLLWLIVFIANAGLGPRVFKFLKMVPGGDKTGHFLLMGTAAFLVNLSLNAARMQVGSLSLLRGSMLVAVAVTAEEFSQVFFASRGFSLIDLAADYAGILLFGWLAARIVAWRERVPVAGRGKLKTDH